MKTILLSTNFLFIKNIQKKFKILNSGFINLFEINFK